MVKIVFVCTSAPELNGHPTGLWIEELAAPYYAFLEKGYEVIISSPKGGPIPIDGGSVSPDFFTEASKKFMHDAEAVGKLSHSVKLSTIDFGKGDIDAIYLAGGHGTGTDFVDDADMKSAIEGLLASDKIVAAVCHGVIGLCQCTTSDGTTPLVSGKNVTGFSDTEEEAVQLTKLVPYLLETKLKEQGAKYEKGGDWSSQVCVDGKLVTGQNPQSSDGCAEAVIKILS
mmetsp:Transcript_7495/g.15648  ORF Transcript_7495/g.15648 Transcript_7495/m.15648 type:complete len:228 (-) Transcript_7495:2095-2778(-)